jgi:hypothetical protein
MRAFAVSNISSVTHFNCLAPLDKRTLIGSSGIVVIPDSLAYVEFLTQFPLE